MKYFTAVSLFIFIHVCALANEVKTISAEQLVSIQQAEKKPRHIVLDVRTSKEFAQGHLPGAINIPHNQVAQRLDELSGYKNDMIIVHCRSGRRAKIAEGILLKQSFSNVKHLSGDYIGWQEKQLPVVQQ